MSYRSILTSLAVIAGVYSVIALSTNWHKPSPATQLTTDANPDALDGNVKQENNWKSNSPNATNNNNSNNSSVGTLEINSTTNVLPNVISNQFSPSTEVKKLTRLSLPGDRTITLLGIVGENALDVAAKITDLAATSSEPIYLILSGPGGSVVEGAALLSAIQASRAPVYTICDVMCASMDAMIHQYGKKRYITDRTIMMFHPAAAGTEGDVDRMFSMSKFLQRYTNKMEFEVAKRWGISFDAYKAKTQTNLWIDAEDSVAEGISDGTVVYHLSQLFKIDNNNGSQPGDNNRKTIIIPYPKFTNANDFQWICKECISSSNYNWLGK